MSRGVSILSEAPRTDPPVGPRRLNRTLILDAISFIARFWMAYTWIRAGVSKLDAHMAVTQNIMAYEIFTPQWSDFLARIIGPLEIAGGVLLLLGIFLRTSSKVSIAVLTLFIIGIAQAWARGLELDCGCFDPTGTTTNYQLEYLTTIGRDLVYIALSAWTVYRPFKKWAIYTP